MGEIILKSEYLGYKKRKALKTVKEIDWCKKVKSLEEKRRKLGSTEQKKGAKTEVGKLF